MAVGRGSPANLISEITKPHVLDHLNPISVACKDHNTLLRLYSASISPSSAFPLQVSQDQMNEEGRAGWPNRGPDLTRSRECEAWPTALKWCFEWVQIHHARGGAASEEAIRDGRLYECLRALRECSALVCTLQKDTKSIAIIGH